MNNATKIILAVIAALTAALQVPAVHDLVIAAIQAHPDLGSLVGGLLTVLALLHNPKTATK
jgi:hypothetical protein